MDQVFLPKTQFATLRDRMEADSLHVPIPGSQVEAVGETVLDRLVVRSGLMDRLAASLGSLAPDVGEMLSKPAVPWEGQWRRGHRAARPGAYQHGGAGAAARLSGSGSSVCRSLGEPPAPLSWATTRVESTTSDYLPRIAYHKLSSRSRRVVDGSPRAGRRAFPILRWV